MIPLAIVLFVLALVVVPPKLLVAVTPLRLTKSKGPFSCRLDVSVDVSPKLGTGEPSSDMDATAVDGSPPVVTLLDGLLPFDVLWSSSLFTIVFLPDADFAGAGGGGP
jgi:hypothetical protein